METAELLQARNFGCSRLRLKTAFEPGNPLRQGRASAVGQAPYF